MVAGYDRSGLIRRVNRHAATGPPGRGDHRQPGDHRLSLPFPFGVDPDPDVAHRRGGFFHSDVLPPCYLQHNVTRRVGAGDRRTGGRGNRDGGKRLSPSFRAHQSSAVGAAAQSAKDDESCSSGQAGGPGPLLFAAHHCCFVPARFSSRSAGRTMFRPLAWTKTLAVGFSSLLAITLVPILMMLFIRGKLRAGIGNPISRFTQDLLASLAILLAFSRIYFAVQSAFLLVTLPLVFRIGSQFMPPLFEGSSLCTCPQPCPESPSLRLPNYSRNRTGSSARFPRSRVSSAPSGAPTAPPITPRWICTTPPSCSSRGTVAARNDLRKTDSGDGR